jgi:S1-C subfamily serine protease
MVARTGGVSARQSGSIGVGFAIGSDQIRKTAEQLIASGRATHPVVGVLTDTTSGPGRESGSRAPHTRVVRRSPRQARPTRQGCARVRLSSPSTNGPALGPTSS